MNTNYHNIACNTISDLQKLASLTSDASGAHRVAWTPCWDAALNWFAEEMRACGAIVSIDAAHNVFATLPGESNEALCIGSHLDCVPNGGWLDGALGVVAGMNILKYYAAHKHEPRRTITVVSWADEEGARFGRSCIGSSAVSGALNPDSVTSLKDEAGISFNDALKRYKTTADTFLMAHDQFLSRNIKQYIELHIEQAPILEKNNLSVACVSGICGCERLRITFTGQRSHLGCPIDMRHDAFLAAAQAALEFRKIAKKYTTDKYTAYCTVGQVDVQPNVINVVPDHCTISLDLRTLHKENLSAMLQEAQTICLKAAAENDVQVKWQSIWQIPPTLFDPILIEKCRSAVFSETNKDFTIVSGPLHDAAEIAKLIPSVMMFVRSNKGLSHCKEENTCITDLEIGISAFMRLAESLLIIEQ